MRLNISIIIALLFFGYANAQLGVGTNSPDSSSAMHIESTTGGLLIPRMTALQLLAIPTPANGLLVYATTTNQTISASGFWYFNGVTWIQVGAPIEGELPVLVANGVISIVSEGITADKLATNSVTSTKIVDGTITSSDMNPTAGITNAQLANNSVTINGTNVALGGSGTITSSPTNTSLPATNIWVGNATNQATVVGVSGDAALSNTGAITIASNAVTSAKILDGTIGTSDLSNNSVTIAKLPSGATNTTFLRGDGTWNTPVDTSIYSADGTISSNRTISQGSNTVAFISTSSNGFSVDGSTFSVDAANNRVGIGTTTPVYNLDLNNGTFGFGNGNSRTQSRIDAGLQGNAGAQSGFFESDSPVNFPGTGWHHLIDCRHANSTNNYALQIAGSFFDQDLWYRKTNNSPTQSWSKILSSTTGWTTQGNAGTSTANNFIGTTDGIDFVTKTANTERMRVTSSGNVGIGTSSPTSTLTVNGSLTQNNGSFRHSGGDFTLDDGGIADATAVRVIGTSGNLYLQSGTGGNIIFRDKTSAVMGTFNESGKLGIGTTVPQEKLDVNGSIKFSNSLMPNGNAGQLWQVLTSNGPGLPPDWKTEPLPFFANFVYNFGDIGSGAGTGFLITNYNTYNFSRSNNSLQVTFGNPTPDIFYHVSATLEGNALCADAIYVINKTTTGFVLVLNERCGVVQAVTIDCMVYLR